MNFSQIGKNRSPLKTIVLTGAIGLLIVIAGTGGFLLEQERLLDDVEKKQAFYLDLIDFRAKLKEFELSKKRGVDVFAEEAPGGKEEPAGMLLLMYDRLATRIQNAGLRNFPELRAARQNTPALLAVENLELFRFELESAIEKARIETRNSAERLVDVNHYYLFFILFILLSLGMTAGWLLHFNYRQSLIPLSQLATQLSLLNRNLPESFHDTAEEMKKELTEPDRSREIAQITESIMSFCGDIEAKNKKLDEIHIMDEKTNLYNYRHFKEHLITEVERAKPHGDKVSLAMIDIDHFKLFNDLHGHLAGDRMLAVLGDIISSQCRLSDVPSRFGGEEFAILFPKTDSDVAREIADRLRRIISQEPLPHEQGEPDGKLTVSVGIATFPGDAEDWVSLIKNADRALYAAKAAGRNTVFTFSSTNNPVDSQG
ncbi:MAG: GGDEF domain-containing protein [Chlorobiaceae bacterium]